MQDLLGLGRWANIEPTVGPYEPNDVGTTPLQKNANVGPTNDCYLGTVLIVIIYKKERRNDACSKVHSTNQG